MARSYTTNLIPSNFADSIYRLKTALKTAGWTVPKSSDGTTYNSSGDQITSGGSGGNGMNNNNAWFIINTPTGTKQWLFQRYTSSAVWTVKVSKLGFLGGSPSSSTAPTATDSGTLASNATLFTGSEGSQRMQIAVEGTAPFGFYAFCYPIGGGNCTGALMQDPLLTGTYPVGDTDAFVYFVHTTGSSNAFTSTSFSSESTGPASYLGSGTVGEAFVINPAANFAVSGGELTGAVGPNPVTADDEALPCGYFRRAALSAPTGYKGQSGYVRWHGSTRSTGDTLSSKARIVVGLCSLPWDSTTTPAV